MNVSVPWAWAILGLSVALCQTATARGLTLPRLDPYAFYEAHGGLLGHHARNVRHIAAEDFKEQDVVPLGHWSNATDGRQQWQWEIYSPGAESHLLIFSEVSMPESGVMQLCNALAKCERYTPGDVPGSRQLVVPVIQGDVVYLTYTQQDQQSGLLLRLAAVMQGLKQSVAELQLHRQQPSRRLQAAASGAAQAPMAAPGPGLGAGPASSADQQPSRGAGPADGPALGPVPPQQALGTQFNIDSMQRTTDDVSQCTPSVECGDYRNEAAAVVDIYAIDMRLGAMGLCTGTIVSAPLGKKYLLTADHCFIDKQDISNFQWWLLIFNYQMPCRYTTTPGPIREVIQGTKLLFYDSKADVLLLDIPESIPDHFHAYKVGFDAAEEVPNRAVAIHHPAGNIKRISYANDSGSIKTTFSAPQFSEDIHPTQATHYQVQWSQGATQGGSSGAALIDADSRKVVGVLTGGTTTCSIFSGADYFGKLSVAWQHGLQNFLSDAPSLLGHGTGLSTVTQLNDGVVVVDSMGGGPVRKHGPAMNFWPSVFVMGPSFRTRIAFYLTDPPQPNEVITAQMSLKGDLPGNGFNPTQNITLSREAFNFTTENCCTNAQPLEITTRMGAAVPGDLVRFQVVFWLTSSTNASYLHVSTVKGVVQSGFESWNTLQPVACMTAPCNFRHPILEAAPPTSPLPTRALFRYVPTRDTAVGQDICLQSGVLELSTVSVYVNGTFTWTLSEAYDTPDCVRIPALDVGANLALDTVVSDNDDYDAVLPLSVVKSIDIYEDAKKPVSSVRGNAAAALIAEATQDGASPVAAAGAPAPASEAGRAQAAMLAPAVSAAPASPAGGSMGGSSTAGGSSDAGTGIGADSSPASGSQGASGQAGQQGQAGGGMGAGGFEAGTGIGAASPAGTVRAASLQAGPPAQQEAASRMSGSSAAVVSVPTAAMSSYG
ncbi:hypothetical protein CVIRNUC_003769 [Coccomyxa viridis]|uniref:Peptidase S1 domain-containing protein n=1 Tax=Coccomyxa viridis TaxID=1274662 RepID=A0AAV1I0K7_9CHLO|nr:hypothetical protein CVIRNUC_003769 [Coccomyxa viridis]